MSTMRGAVETPRRRSGPIRFSGPDAGDFAVETHAKEVAAVVCDFCAR
jgi:hypothetical protein